MRFLSGIKSAILGAGLVAFAACATLAGDAARADDAPSMQDIVEALKPRKTRGLSAKATRAEIEKAQTIEALHAKAAESGLSRDEREQFAEVAADHPTIDLAIYFGVNSAKISPRSRNTLQALGKALQQESLRGATILIAGHTDAAGRAEYNQTLSERRAEAVRQYLLKRFSLEHDKLTAVGYGAERLKNPAAPYASINRRVQVVNLTSRSTASSTLVREPAQE